MRVFENVNLTKTIQLWPRSKKRRIRKKWMKNPAKRRIEPDLNCYAIGNDIHCHPVVAAQLRRAIKEQARVEVGFNGFRTPLFGNQLFGYGGI